VKILANPARVDKIKVTSGTWMTHDEQLELLISPEYLLEQQRLHSEPRGYGQRGRKWADTVLARMLSYGCVSVLDYGCGTGSLKIDLLSKMPQLDVREYDPAIPFKRSLPDPVDLVVCTDVLEHVEGDKIDAVLTHLSLLAHKVIFVVISLVPTAKTLSDGQQAHISLHSVDWWREKFEALHWRVVQELNVKPEKQWAAVLTR
jgi:2-polyprenyl-3-methyl-5-hydroxy-6-metoxy-1,4-benzoquinol methylase